MRVLQWLYDAPGTGEQRGWVLPGTWMGAVWGVGCGDSEPRRCLGVGGEANQVCFVWCGVWTGQGASGGLGAVWGAVGCLL